MAIDSIKRYEDQKIKEVLLYILGKTGVLDYYHLMKILYLAERQHLAKWGDRIITDDYYALPHGPVPTRIYDSLKAVKLLSKRLTSRICMIRAKRDADFSGVIFLPV